MRALVASCVFPPEPVVSAKTSLDIARFLDSIGYDTVVICPKPTRNYKASTRVFVDQVKTFRLFSIKSEQSTFLSRFVENISFGVSSFFHIIFTKKYEVIYSNAWPVFATGLILLAAKMKGSKIILSVQDLYPESLAQQSRVNSTGLLYKLLLRLDRLISNSVDHVIVISESFYHAYNITRNISSSKLSVIRNWVDSNNVNTMDKEYARKQLSKTPDNFFSEDDSFYIVYGGNIGVASGLGILPELIQVLPRQFKFIVAGDGALLRGIMERVDDAGASERIFFFSPWPENYTSIVFSAADLLFLPTAPGQSSASVPSKLITYMLSERAIFAIVDSTSDTAREVYKSEGGFVCSFYDIEKIKNSLMDVARISNNDLIKMGKNARNYALENYSFESVKPKLLNLLNGLL